MFSKTFSAIDLERIILSAKDANLEKLEYNGLVLTFQKAAKPEAEINQLINYPIHLPNLGDGQQDTKPQDSSPTQEELEYLMHTDPVAYESAIAGDQWNKQN